MIKSIYQHNESSNFRGNRFTVGRDSRGSWIVEDKEGRLSGVFATENAAFHFASQETCYVDSVIARSLGYIDTLQGHKNHN